MQFMSNRNADLIIFFTNISIVFDSSSSKISFVDSTRRLGDHTMKGSRNRCGTGISIVLSLRLTFLERLIFLTFVCYHFFIYQWYRRLREKCWEMVWGTFFQMLLFYVRSPLQVCLFILAILQYLAMSKIEGSQYGKYYEIGDPTKSFV